MNLKKLNKKAALDKLTDQLSETNTIINNNILPAQSELQQLSEELNDKKSKLNNLVEQLAKEEDILKTKRFEVSELDSKEKNYSEKLNKLNEEIESK